MFLNSKLLTGEAPVVITIINNESHKIHCYDGLRYYHEGDRVALEGSRTHLVVEADSTEKAYGKVISHLIERAVSAEKEVEKLKEENARLQTREESPAYRILQDRLDEVIRENQSMRTNIDLAYQAYVKPHKEE